MTKAESDLLIQESDKYIRGKYPVPDKNRLIEYALIGTEVNIEDGRYFPIALLKAILPPYHTIKIDLETIIDYFRRPRNH